MSIRLFPLVLPVFLFLGCRHQNVQPQAVEKSTERSRQLALLAAHEAGLVGDADARLTRQLNIANGIRQRFTDEDSVKVLEEARATLTTVGKDLSGYARISGWVSVAQLSRGAHDDSIAKEATVEARRELEALPDQAERCEYVMGVAEEVSQAFGNHEAAALLGKAGEWVAGVPDEAVRRRARLAFSVALFNLDAWEEGVATLRHEGDAAWASDVLLAMSTLAGGNDGRAQANSAAYADGTFIQATPPPMAALREEKIARPVEPSATDKLDLASSIAGASSGYGKPLSFRSGFEGKARSGR